MREIKFRYTVVRKNGHIFHHDFSIGQLDSGIVRIWIEQNHIGSSDVPELHRRQ